MLPVGSRSVDLACQKATSSPDVICNSRISTFFIRAGKNYGIPGIGCFHELRF
jgi:hypothetical protein